MAVAGRIGAEYHALEVEQRVQGFDFARANEVALGAHVVEHALDLMEPVHLVVVGGKAYGAAAVPSGALAGLLLEALVELGAVQVHLGHVEAADEVGNQPCGVPGRPGSELAFLHQHDVRPAFLGQVVGESHPHHAAADYHNTGLILHRLTLTVPARAGRRRRC